MHSSFIAVFLAVLAPMAVLAWRPHGPPPDYNRWNHPGPENLRSSATSSIAAEIPTSSQAVGFPTMSIPEGGLPSGTFVPTGVSGGLARSTGSPIIPYRGAISTGTLSTFAGTAATASATASASVSLVPYG